ncbi:MAG: pilus assembly protein [Caulobacteraceae bacterium]|nr:pilus assembly protein [Caulobacter sp.]
MRPGRFVAATGGATAIEFAFCLPVLLVLLFGMIEVGQLMVVQHRSDNAAGTVGDVISRNDKLTDSQETDVFAAASDILGSSVTGKPDLRVSQIGVNAAGIAHWDWSDRQGSWFTAYQHCAVLNPSDVRGLSLVALAPGAHLLVSEIHYTWSSPLDFVLQKPIDLGATILASPRRGQVTRVTSPTPSACL